MAVGITAYRMTQKFTEPLGHFLHQVCHDLLNTELGHFQHAEQAGNLYFQQKYDEALIEIEKSIAINSSYAQAHSLKGLCLASKEDYAKALIAYNHAIAINPNEPWYYFNRAIAYVKLNNLNEALKDFDNFLENNPDHLTSLILVNRLKKEIDIRKDESQKKPKQQVKPEPTSLKQAPQPDPKVLPVLQPKEQPKVQLKEQPKVQPKEQPRVQPKEQKKTEPTDKKEAKKERHKARKAERKAKREAYRNSPAGQLAIAKQKAKAEKRAKQKAIAVQQPHASIQDRLGEWMARDRQKTIDLSNKSTKYAESLHQAAQANSVSKHIKDLRDRNDAYMKEVKKHSKSQINVAKSASELLGSSFGKCSSGGFFSTRSQSSTKPALECIRGSLSVNGSSPSTSSYCRPAGSSDDYVYFDGDYQAWSERGKDNGM